MEYLEKPKWFQLHTAFIWPLPLVVRFSLDDMARIALHASRLHLG